MTRKPNTGERSPSMYAWLSRALDGVYVSIQRIGPARPMRMRISELALSPDAFDGDVVALATASHIPGLDSEDIAQELRISVWRATPKYSSVHGAKKRTFFRNVMRNCILDLVKYAQRKKRLITMTADSLDALLEVDPTCEAHIRKYW